MLAGKNIGMHIFLNADLKIFLMVIEYGSEKVFKNNHKRTK